MVVRFLRRFRGAGRVERFPGITAVLLVLGGIFNALSFSRRSSVPECKGPYGITSGSSF